MQLKTHQTELKEWLAALGVKCVESRTRLAEFAPPGKEAFL